MSNAINGAPSAKPIQPTPKAATPKAAHARAPSPAPAKPKSNDSFNSSDPLGLNKSSQKTATPTPAKAEKTQTPTPTPQKLAATPTGSTSKAVANNNAPTPTPAATLGYNTTPQNLTATPAGGSSKAVTNNSAPPPTPTPQATPTPAATSNPFSASNGSLKVAVTPTATPSGDPSGMSGGSTSTGSSPSQTPSQGNGTSGTAATPATSPGNTGYLNPEGLSGQTTGALTGGQPTATPGYNSDGSPSTTPNATTPTGGGDENKPTPMGSPSAGPAPSANPAPAPTASVPPPPSITETVDAANTSGLRFHDDYGDGWLNGYGGDLEKAVTAYQSDPSAENFKNVQDATNTYTDRLKYNRATNETVGKVQTTVAENIAANKYGSLTFTGTMPAQDAMAYAQGYNAMMNKFGSYMTPEQVAANANDSVSIGNTPGAGAATSGKITVLSDKPQDNVANIAGHEQGHNMTSDNYSTIVNLKYKGDNAAAQSSRSFFIEDANNYLMRQSMPDSHDMSAQEKVIDAAVKAGKISVDDLAKAMYGGDPDAMSKLFKTFPSPDKT